MRGRTLRELVWMSEGRCEIGDRMSWNHTSSLMGLIHNVNYKKRVAFDHYNPYTESKPSGTVLTKDTISALRQLAPPGRGGGSRG